MMTKEEIKAQIDSVGMTAGEFVCNFASPCTLTEVQKADIEASRIISKWATAIPMYIEACAELRSEDPTMGDATVRALAKTSIL